MPRKFAGLFRASIGMAFLAELLTAAQMKDARLRLVNILSAEEKGAHVINYVKVRSVIKEDSMSVGVDAYDELSEEAVEVRAKKIVCAVGPWTNVFMQKENSQFPPQVRTTKGVHIVVKGCISKHAVLIPARRDQRVFFVIHWMGNSLIGTTDTDFEDYPDIKETKEEIKNKFGIPYKKVALFVGRMGIAGGRKKVSHAIDIFKEINDPDYGLVIVGSGLNENLKQRINKKNTKYLGEIHDPEHVQISKIFKMADIFLMPGHVGLGINQAFYWGLPVLTEEDGQPPEFNYLVNNKNGYVVKNNDLSTLKEKVLYLFNNDNICSRFSKNAKEYIIENASVENMFNGFYESINKMDIELGKSKYREVHK